MEATSITLTIGTTSVEATLNDTATARALEASLPLAIPICCCGVDLCGHLPHALPYTQAQVRRGWANGDINYNPGGEWLAVFVADEENSMRYGGQVTVGHVTGPLDALKGIEGEQNLRITRRD